MMDNEENESSWEFDWRAALPLIPMLAGLALILASVFLPDRMLKTRSWSQEQAQKYQAASSRLHSLSHGSLHPSPDADPAAMHKELEQANKDYQAIRVQYDTALARPKKLVWILRGMGIALLVMGGYTAYSMRHP